MKVGIIGCGTMGSGIAQIASTNNCEVVLCDTNEAALEKAKQKLQKIMNRLIEKGRVNEAEAKRILDGISYTTDFQQFENADLVIEAIIENAEIKKTVFKKVESIVSEACIIASNTSSLSITSLAAALNKPERFIGIHFFNPAPLMKLVEIIPAIQTEESIVTKAKNIIDSWGKLTVLAKDTSGFIVNKVARPFYSEALRILEEGVTGLAQAEAIATIDWAITELGGFKMGPFTLMDFIGNDVNYTVTETVFKAFYYDARYKPAFTQKRLAEAGYHGKKSGRGYYTYAEDAVEPTAVKDETMGKLIVDRIVVMLINEAADTLQFNIATKEDIDLAMTKGVNYPKGLFAWADEIGIENCVTQLDELYDTYHEDRYRCSVLLRNMVKQKERFY